MAWEICLPQEKYMGLWGCISAKEYPDMYSARNNLCKITMRLVK